MFGIGEKADHTVLEKINQGDEQMLIYMYKQHYTMVKNFILKNSGDEDAVDDILQDTVIAVWKNANKTNFLLRSKLSTYIMAIAKNLWYKELKKKTKFKLVDETQKMDLGSEEMNLNMDQSIIIKMVQEMDETCRRLLSYFYFDGFSTKLIADKLNFANADTVKSKKYQCFKKLQSSVLNKYKKEDLI
ncbi:MAG: sigma-70 family RNA polymerase sigma factor [Bacteroidetes bacterium]|nr:sigma-70 family RNA polymerase sigma factor [Bacteroidota bacterium]